MVMAGVSGASVGLETQEGRLFSVGGVPNALWSRNGAVTLLDNGGRASDQDGYVLYDDTKLWLFRCRIGDVEMHNGAEFNGWCVQLNNLELNDDSKFGKSLGDAYSDEFDIRGNVDVLDTSEFQLRGGRILGNVNVDGDAELDIIDVHVEGVATFVNAGAALPCTANGGAFTINYVPTDLGGRLTRNVGF
jgi:hypothetical protein